MNYYVLTGGSGTYRTHALIIGFLLASRWQFAIHGWMGIYLIDLHRRPAPSEHVLG